MRSRSFSPMSNSESTAVSISSTVLPAVPSRDLDAESANSGDGQEQAAAAAEFELLKIPASEIQEPAGGQPQEAEEEEEDGFKTPTSVEHRIPVVTQCPGAPRRGGYLRRKRKPSSPPYKSQRNNNNNNYLDLTEDVESLFPTQLMDDLCREMKKARRDRNVDVDGR